MSEIELRFLGEFQVLRDGAVASLPPSRKTRALLAYLALQDRPLRREMLCELLWEVPDDPRGSLRWSLSKLRRLVDSPNRKRVLADRQTVNVDASDLCIDVLDLFGMAESGFADIPDDALEQAALRFRGHFLEGLELSGFHDFHSWCVAERERTVQAQAALLRDLANRLADRPERSLPHARALVTLCPYDEAARAALIRLLIELRHTEEAEQHYRLGLRMLRELGITSTGALASARRNAPAVEAPPPPRPVSVAATDVSPVPDTSELLGRDAEIARLTEAFGQVKQSGKARFFVLSGEPGIGKSSLLDSVSCLVRNAGASVFEARAYASETERPFALWVDALRRFSPKAENEVFEDRDLDHRDRLLGRLSSLVAREAGQRPVVVLFDDYQWCDESSAAALHYVARMNLDRPLLGVVAARSGELRDNVPAQQALHDLRRDHLVEELPVGPLAQDAIQRLIAAQAPDADSQALAGECGGNPLFAIELARTGGSGGGSLDVIVRERLARLDEETAEVLRWAALLGPHIRVGDLSELTGMDAETVGVALERAVHQGILMTSGGGLRFSHDLVARGVYNDISPLRRQLMHRQVATRLEANSAIDLEYAADLAHHAAQSGDPAMAARALVLAGRLCLRFFANEKARSHARRGLQLAGRLSGAERVRVSIELHEVMMSAAPTADWEQATREFESLAEQALDHGATEHARLAYHLASTLRWEHGQWSDARDQSLQAARVVRGGDEEHNIIGLAETAKCLALLERDLSQADALLMEAQALAERRRFRHHAIPLGLGLLRVHEDRLAEAEELFLDARMLCKAAGDHFSEFQAAENLALIAWYRNDIDLALERCEALMQLAEKLREGSEEPLARALYGLCLYHRQDDAAALDQALADLRIADAKYRLAYAQSRAAMIDLERARYSSVIERATEALACAELLQRPTEMLLAHTMLFRANEATGLRDQAATHREALRSLSESGAATWARQQASAALETAMAPPS